MKFKDEVETRRIINETLENISSEFHLETTEELKRIMFDNAEAKYEATSTARVYSIILFIVIISTLVALYFSAKTYFVIIIFIGLALLVAFSFISVITKIIINRVNTVELYLNTLQEQMFKSDDEND